MVQIFIDEKAYDVEDGITVIQACESAGVEIPRFCYHEKLSIAGNCRMCLVEMENSNKPVASCAMPVAEGMKIKTNSEMVVKARKGVMEFLLINHPLDCPICDQGGECDLQDQAMAYGSGISRFVEQKRAVKDKNLGPLIKTHMTRCIHCTRCVRFSEEIAGNNTQLGAIGRGEDTEITTYLEEAMDFEMSGNVIDLCPVGALTSKPYEFVARPWELKKTETIDVFDAVGSSIRIDSKSDKILRVLPRINEEINDEWISDKTRFAYDGINNQRIDRYYLRNSEGKLAEESEENILKIIHNSLSNTKASQVAALVGNTLDCESIFSFKKFLDELKIDNYDCRQDDSFFLPFQRFSYIFNSTIKGIDDSDLCVLVGTDIKKEAPILSSRIRQKFLSSPKTYKIFSVGNFNLNFAVDYLGGNPSSLKKLSENKNLDVFKKSKKPIFILGQGAMCHDDAADIFNYCLNFYQKISKNIDWNGFNVLQTFSGRVGALDLGFYNKKNISRSLIKQIYDGKFEVLYLMSADEINFEKIPKKTFVIYHGHHGDKAVKRADLIIPMSCFTEKEGIYVNLEGRPQISSQVKFPIDGVNHSWTFLNKLSKLFNLSLYSDHNDLREKMFLNHEHLSYINQIQLSKINKNKKSKFKFSNQEMKSNISNFYMTDSVSRNSKIMSDCSLAFLKETNVP
jgi:NADH-quinone oxidoreductase subunit G